MNRFDIFEVVESDSLAPIQELADRVIVSDSGIFISNRDGKELEKTFGGLRSNIGNDRGNLERSGSCDGQSSFGHWRRSLMDAARLVSRRNRQYSICGIHDQSGRQQAVRQEAAEVS